MALSPDPSSPPTDLGFRPMRVEDLALMQRWLVDPDVRPWFSSDDLSVGGIEEHYRAKLAADSTEEQWLVLAEGRPVGWLQTYEIAAHPAYADACVAVGADPMAAGLDYLLGEPGLRNRGLGPVVITRFVEDVVFALHPEWPEVCSGPHPDNVRSWRALERAGFDLLGDIETEDGPERLMARRRL